MSTHTGVWSYREGSGYEDGPDLVGFAVEAIDGRIGKVIYAGTSDGAGAYLVIDTGLWIFGKHVVLPAGAVALIDQTRETAYVDRTRQEIKDAPEFATLIETPETGYLDQLGTYYGAFYGHHGL